MNFHLRAHDCIYKRQKSWVMNKDRLVHDHFYLMTSSNWSMWHQIDQCDIITVSVSTKMCSIVLGISDLKSWYHPFPEKLVEVLSGIRFCLVLFGTCFASHDALPASWNSHSRYIHILWRSLVQAICEYITPDFIKL